MWILSQWKKKTLYEEPDARLIAPCTMQWLPLPFFRKPVKDYRQFPISLLSKVAQWSKGMYPLQGTVYGNWIFQTPNQGIWSDKHGMHIWNQPCPGKPVSGGCWCPREAVLPGLFQWGRKEQKWPTRLLRAALFNPSGSRLLSWKGLYGSSMRKWKLQKDKYLFPSTPASKRLSWD